MTQRNTGENWDGKYPKKAVDSDRWIFENQIASSNWLTTNEAAEYLRTTPNQIRNWVYQGKIRAYKLLGKSLRFKPKELDLLHKGGHLWE
ncbi:MAG: helix-turn-helix domain-containing protein [Bdellovibrionaceae bacterium]|nr:helix-turn-helix domain-containing protein [Pseudobdellovibrionaceae bacterium]